MPALPWLQGWEPRLWTPLVAGHLCPLSLSAFPPGPHTGPVCHPKSGDPQPGEGAQASSAMNLGPHVRIGWPEPAFRPRSAAGSWWHRQTELPLLHCTVRIGCDRKHRNVPSFPSSLHLARPKPLPCQTGAHVESVWEAALRADSCPCGSALPWMGGEGVRTSERPLVASN